MKRHPIVGSVGSVGQIAEPRLESNYCHPGSDPTGCISVLYFILSGTVDALYAAKISQDTTSTDGMVAGAFVRFPLDLMNSHLLVGW